MTSLAVAVPSPMATPPEAPLSPVRQPAQPPNGQVARLNAVTAHFLAGDDDAAEDAARLAWRSGLSLTRIYESVRAAVYGSPRSRIDRSALTMTGHDERLTRLAARLPVSAPRRTAVDALLLRTSRRGIPECVRHMLSDVDINAFTLDLSNITRYQRGDAIFRQFADIRYLVLDAADASPHELGRCIARLEDLGLINRRLDVIVLADDPSITNVLEIDIFDNLSVVADLPALMQAARVPSENPLTSREQIVLMHISNGMTNQHAARAMGISIATVKTYLERAQHKLQSVDRASAVAIALRRGWIQ
jgi:DNA-binding CsgD family transcriptional regulator